MLLKCAAIEFIYEKHKILVPIQTNYQLPFLDSMEQEQGQKLNFFRDDLTIENLPDQCISWKGTVGLLHIGKIEHAMEGCACPMGSITKSLLNELQVGANQWVLVDTEAGVEHFGRGVLEGADVVVMVVDPTYESVLLAAKAQKMVAATNKKFMVVLNKQDVDTEAVLRQQLSEQGVQIDAVLGHSAQINKANLTGNPVDHSDLQEGLDKIIDLLT